MLKNPPINPNLPAVRMAQEFEGIDQFLQYKITDPKLIAQLDSLSDKMVYRQKELTGLLQTTYGIKDAVPLQVGGHAFVVDPAPADDDKRWAIIGRFQDGGYAYIPNAETPEGIEFSQELSTLYQTMNTDVAVMQDEQKELFGIMALRRAIPDLPNDFSPQFLDFGGVYVVRCLEPNFASYAVDAILNQGVFNPNRYVMLCNILVVVNEHLKGKMEAITESELMEINEEAIRRKALADITADFEDGFDDAMPQSPKGPNPA